MEHNFNPTDKISVDVPLFIRLLEFAREDAKTDLDLHKATENILAMSKGGKTLTMNDYDGIVKDSDGEDGPSVASQLNKSKLQPAQDQINENKNMKTQFITEAKRFQKLAGILKENDSQSLAQAEKVVNKVEQPLEAKLDKLSPAQIQQLQAELTKLGITANTSVEDAAHKIEGNLSEAEGDDKQKLAKALSSIGTGLIGSMLVTLIPLAVGQTTGLGMGAGLGITFAAGGLLVGLAKALGHKESDSEHGNN